MLKMSIPWFEENRNNASVLSSRLSTDCQSVNALTTFYFAIIVQSLSSVIAGIIISFIFSWRIALVALALVPLILAVGVIQVKKSAGFSSEAGEAYQQSTGVIMEAIINIRTVLSFNYDRIITEKYSKKLEKPEQLAYSKGNQSGFLFGLSQFILYFSSGLIFFIATVFAVNYPEEVTRNDIFTSIFAFLFSAMSAGNNLYYMPDVAEAKNAAANLFLIIDGAD